MVSERARERESPGCTQRSAARTSLDRSRVSERVQQHTGRCSADVARTLRGEKSSRVLAACEEHERFCRGREKMCGARLVEG